MQEHTELLFQPVGEATCIISFVFGAGGGWGGFWFFVCFVVLGFLGGGRCSLFVCFLKETSDIPQITVRGVSSQVASSENLASFWVQEGGEGSSFRELTDPGSPDKISLSTKTTLLPSLGYLSPPSSPESAGASNS